MQKLEFGNVPRWSLTQQIDFADVLRMVLTTRQKLENSDRSIASFFLVDSQDVKTNFGDYKLLDALFAETNMVISRYY